MPATPARISFITQAYRRVTAGPVERVVTTYGSKARDTVEPVPTFFDSVDDAGVLAQERLDLLSAERALFTIKLAEATPALDLDIVPLLPTATVIDDEQETNRDMLVVGMEIDLETEQSALTAWG